jgi:hypothetical protein
MIPRRVIGLLPVQQFPVASRDGYDAGKRFARLFVPPLKAGVMKGSEWESNCNAEASRELEKKQQ